MEVAEATNATPCPGGPFAREAALALELLHSAAPKADLAALRRRLPWMPQVSRRPGHDESARYKESLHDHPLAYPIAWASNRSSTYCAGGRSDCCSNARVGAVEDAAGIHADNQAQQSLSRSCRASLAASGWVTLPSVSSRLDAPFWEGEDTEGNWDGVLLGDDYEAYEERRRSNALPFPGPLVPLESQALKVGLDPATKRPLDHDGAMPPPIHADMAWHGTGLGVLLSGSARRAPLMLRLSSSKESDQELQSPISRGFTCSSATDSDPEAMSDVNAVDSLAQGQLDAAGTPCVASIVDPSTGQGIMGPTGLALTSQRRTLRCSALQAISAKRGVALITIKIQDQAHGLGLSPLLADAISAARHSMHSRAKSGLLQEVDQLP